MLFVLAEGSRQFLERGEGCCSSNQQAVLDPETKTPIELFGIRRGSEADGTGHHARRSVPNKSSDASQVRVVIGLMLDARMVCLARRDSGCGMLCGSIPTIRLQSPLLNSARPCQSLPSNKIQKQ